MNDDLISRQAAIDALIAEGRNVDSRYLESERIIHESDAVEVISLLPPAQPERKKGKWIVIMNEPNITFDECKCSECGVVEYFNKGWKKFNFCPNCGAQLGERRK